MFYLIFEQLGLSKNEGKIYETLLEEGEASVSTIAKKANIHRRNVYDSIQRLIEKGLVFEIIQSAESRYQAVDPNKLMEMIQEKEQLLAKIMPQLQETYSKTPHKNEVYIYRGPEGWKNYLRDILRIGEPFYCIGGKGAWMDERVMNFFPHFTEEMKKRKIECFHLFDHEVKQSKHPITNHVGKNYKFFPKGYSAPASIDIFGDHINIISNIHLGGMEEDFSFTVIVNQQIADAFRIWFKFMYDFCPKEK